ncbi:hypothetical protein CEUSTIGMA_g3428.t1 [Chlamydomonas eustigma]|uniref:CAAX prenyl protease n=1 Tax=Chlamydomonas eustigma TaxID=1157962 RepID=A0A250WYX6_9CHLO|nr:hypothetical protein CEUSTIGMA_g3428.t1 [Chlamydomonas eustigma]|eukprot:GAX75985.1 hypothetical protein CEUSTIGMA_g3428.t1 [Chlamydomonas eustigma]
MSSVLEILDDLPFLQLFIAFQILVTIFHLYLDFRQLHVLKSPKPPPVLAEHFNQDLYLKTQAYSLDKWYFGFWRGMYSLFESMIMLTYKVLPWIWMYSAILLHKHLPEPALAWLNAGSPVPGASRRFELAQTTVFVMILLASNMVTGLPWSLYSTFVIEEKHGFNKQTIGLFFTDMIKSVLLGSVMVPPIVVGITYILQIGGAWLALYLWGFMLALSLFFMTIYPTVIAPLFNKFETLPEGSLRSKIEQLASGLKFPLKKLFKVDGSKRSAHSNAYMYGFWKNKRIVLYDTLLNHCSEEQVVAVLAHELGHWKLGHTPVLFTVNQFVMLFSFSLFTFIRNSQGLLDSFGFSGMGQPAFISMVLFQFISSPLDEVIQFCQNLVSRTFEFQADGFAVSQGVGGHLREALLKLEEENKSAMNVDPLYSSFHYSHPPLAERLKAIDVGVSEQKKKDS